MPAEHKILKFILPYRAFAAVKNGTKQWLIECQCGHLRDLWDAGGLRFKAAGEPRQILKCPECGKITWHRTRKKTESEKQGI